MDTTELDFQDFLGDNDDGGRRLIDYSVLDQEDHGSVWLERWAIFCPTPIFAEMPPERKPLAGVAASHSVIPAKAGIQRER